MSNTINGFAPIDATRPGKTVYRLMDKPEAMPTDTVELSSDVMRLRGVDGQIRMEKVLQVRHDMITGRLYTPEAFERAFNRAYDAVIAAQ